MSVQSALHKVIDALNMPQLHDEVDAEDDTAKATDSGEEDLTDAPQ